MSQDTQTHGPVSYVIAAALGAITPTVVLIFIGLVIGMIAGPGIGQIAGVAAATFAAVILGGDAKTPPHAWVMAGAFLLLNGGLAVINGQVDLDMLLTLIIAAGFFGGGFLQRYRRR